MPETTKRATLTDRTVRTLKPSEKQYSVQDPQTTGLSLRVLPSGRKSWSFRYRHGGGWRRVSLGPYPAVGLKDARDLAAETSRAVKLEGRDPSNERRLQRRAPDRTFRGLCTRYLDEHALGPAVGPRQAKETEDGPPVGALLAEDGTEADVWTYEVRQGTPRKRSWKINRWLLAREIPQHWWTRDAQEIQRSEIKSLVKAKAYGGAGVQANRLLTLIQGVYNFALEEDLVEYSPAARMKKPGVERERDRVLTEDEIRTFWQATEDMAPPMRALWRLRLLTAQRRTEVAGLRWEELDLDAGWWTIPAERVKNKTTHRVPITPMVREILEELPRIEEYVLPGARGSHQQAKARKSIPIEDFSGHDLRRSASTIMGEAKIPRLHIKLVLNHADASVTKIYDRHRYEAEKRLALEAVERRVREILGVAGGGEVIPITRGAS